MNVMLHHNNETGKPCYAVVSANDLELWLDSFVTREEAENYCDMYQYNIVHFWCSIVKCNVHKK